MEDDDRGGGRAGMRQVGIATHGINAVNVYILGPVSLANSSSRLTGNRGGRMTPETRILPCYAPRNEDD